MVLLNSGRTVATGGEFIEIASTELSAAAQYVDFSGLDIEGHGGIYKVFVLIRNQSAANSVLQLNYNGDTTSTNYYISQDLGASGNTSTIGNSYIAENEHFEILITKLTSYKASATSHGGRDAGAGLRGTTIYHQHVSDTANITSLRLGSTQANTYGIGTIIKIYKVI